MHFIFAMNVRNNYAIRKANGCTASGRQAPHDQTGAPAYRAWFLSSIVVLSSWLIHELNELIHNNINSYRNDLRLI